MNYRMGKLAILTAVIITSTTLLPSGAADPVEVHLDDPDCIVTVFTQCPDAVRSNTWFIFTQVVWVPADQGSNTWYNVFCIGPGHDVYPDPDCGVRDDIVYRTFAVPYCLVCQPVNGVVGPNYRDYFCT